MNELIEIAIREAMAEHNPDLQITLVEDVTNTEQHMLLAIQPSLRPEVYAVYHIVTKFANPAPHARGIEHHTKAYHLWDGRVLPYEGWFHDTTPRNSSTMSLSTLEVSENTHQICWPTPGYQTGWGELPTSPGASGQGWIAERDTDEHPALLCCDEPPLEDEPEPERFTLRQWRIKARMSRGELADAAGIDYKAMTRAELVDYRPVERSVAERIVAVLRARFEQHPEYARWEMIPEKPEDITGWSIA